MTDHLDIRIGPGVLGGVVVVMGQQREVCAAVEQALAAAGFQVIPPAVAAHAGPLDSLRPLAVVFQSAQPGGPPSAPLAGSGERAEPMVLGIADIVVDRHRRTVRRGAHYVELGRREFDALVVLVQNQPWVVSKQFLLETVWNYGGYAPNVVEVAISGLRRKLESHGPRVIQTVRGLGYAARTTPT